jgi:NTE family protein
MQALAIWAGATLLLLALGACSKVPDYPNQRLESAANTPPVSPIGGDPDAPIILIAFSGGGSRAAALGLGVLEQLALTYPGGIYPAGKTRESLADRIKVVSSVSGGSVIAAWFGLKGPEHLEELKDGFLSRDNMATLLWKAADPVTWTRLVFGQYTRIGALRDLLDRELFSGARFADMWARPGAPFTVMNATDMESGEVFAFTPQRFDDICSDLGQLPLSVAVSASAAFPVALSPLSLRNYSYEGCKRPLPGWISADLTLQGPRYINLEEYKRARYANALRNGDNPYRDEHYLHLLDGGLADNQGVGSLREALISSHSEAQVLVGINRGLARRIVVISVNARSDTDGHIGENPAVPGLLSVVNSVIGTPVDATTAYANASLQDLVATLKSAGAQAGQAPGHALFAGLRVYGIPIDFDQFPPDQATMQHDVKNIGTTWTLTPAQTQETVDAGKLLLLQHPCFQRLLVDLDPKTTSADPAFARRSCRFEDDDLAEGQ